MAAAVLTTGRRTVANLLRTVGGLAPGHNASYRRVLSAARWSGLELGCALTRFLLDHLIPDGGIDLVGDDTVDGHPGPRVYGKSRHRDTDAIQRVVTNTWKPSRRTRPTGAHGAWRGRAGCRN